MNPGRKPFVPDKRDWEPRRLEALIEEGEARPIEWDVLRILNQADTPHCVGFGTGGLLNADDEFHGSPDLYEKDCHDLYYEIKEYEGEPRVENGAYVRSGIIIAQKKGWVTHYAVLKNTNEVVDWLQLHGPVLMGTDWTSDLNTPGEDGIATPTGVNYGGHCWWICGYDPDEDTFLCVNSWGEDWGLGGYFWLTREGLDALIAGIDYPGEAWAVVGPADGDFHPEEKRSIIEALIDLLKRIISVFR